MVHEGTIVASLAHEEDMSSHRSYINDKKPHIAAHKNLYFFFLFLLTYLKIQLQWEHFPSRDTVIICPKTSHFLH